VHAGAKEVTVSNRGRGQGWIRRNVAIACVTLASSACTSSKPTPSRSEQALEAKEQHLATDRIGVRFVYPFESEEAQAVIKAMGLPLIARHNDRIASFSLEKNASLEEIWGLAEDLSKKHPKGIIQAGVVELTPRPESPNEPSVRVVTRELIAEFPETISSEAARAIIAEQGVEILKEHPYVAGQYLGRVPTGVDPREVAAELERKGARYSHPNYLLVDQDRETIPTDTYFPRQWHHKNDGAPITIPGIPSPRRATPDADIDTTLAWDFSRGAVSWPVVAILEGKPADLAHPDYAENIVGEAVFRDCDSTPTMPCEAYVESEFAHASASAGLVAARDNGEGVVGVCPECRLHIVGAQGSTWSKALAFDYAVANGADIISNSWGLTMVPTNLSEAISRATSAGRGGRGAVVVFAMHSTGGWSEDCLGATPDISAREDVIAVSAVSDMNERAPAGYGDCADILAPSEMGILSIATTDVRGPAGINYSIFRTRECDGLPDAADTDYTFCAGGTSAATPIAAGVAGLALAQRPELGRRDVQRLLQDTADKVEPATAAYEPSTGFSRPSAPPLPELPVGSTHAYGRVNAYEAVRIVGTFAGGGNRGVDLFMRDNALDWGNTEQPSNALMERTRGFIPHWESVDIKVDAPPYEATPPTAQTFDAFRDEPASGGQDNRVYVRVHSRGVQPATNVNVRLYWTFAGTSLPRLPYDFWARFPDDIDTPQWKSARLDAPLDPISVHYSGASVAGTADDRSRIVRFVFSAPEVDPSRPDPTHHCLLAVADTAQDRIRGAAHPERNVDVINPRDNNVTQRNIHVIGPGRRHSLPYEESIFVHNPTGAAATTVLRAEAPKGWQVTMDSVPLDQPFSMAADESKLAWIKVYSPSLDSEGTVRIIQEIVDPKSGERSVLGGSTYRFEAKSP
jgi:hypothetical protein